MKIDYVFFDTCPNGKRALDDLRDALSELKLDCELNVHEYSDLDFPNDYRWWGSPTILVDDKDIFGGTKGSEKNCRVYRNDDKPSKDNIVKKIEALRKAASNNEL